MRAVANVAVIDGRASFVVESDEREVIEVQE